MLYKTIIFDDEPNVIDDMRLLIDWEKCGFEVVKTFTSAYGAAEIVKKNHAASHYYRYKYARNYRN